MTDYMQKIAMLLKTAEVPNVEILQNDEAIFEALKAHIVSLQDIAAKADTWRMAAENWRKDFGEADNALNEIKRALIDCSEVPTDMQDTAGPTAIASTVTRSLEYLTAARDSARMYSAQLEAERQDQSRKLNAFTSELRQKIDVLESQVNFHRDTVKNLEGANEGLAQALRIVLDTRETR